MGKTIRRHAPVDDRWVRKGGPHQTKSRKKEKQDFLKQIEDFDDDGR